MSREDADAVLHHRQNGTFLIRQSINPTRREEPLTLSVKSVIMHCIIVLIYYYYIYYVSI